MAGTPNRSGGNRFTPPLTGDVGNTAPNKPASLTANAAVKWDELMAQIRVVVLDSIDVHELAILAELLAQSDSLRDLVEADPLDMKASRLYLQVFDRIHRLSAAFGLNPSDRARIKAPKQEEVDPFMEYLKGKAPTN